MRAGIQHITIKSFPDTVPVFPINGALLLPYGLLPLTVFEPRYLTMIEDVLGGRRFVALVQPRSATTETVTDDAPLYSIGCLGRITSFDEIEDGRFQIVLTGMCRFRVTDELEMKNGYRQLSVDYSEFKPDLEQTTSIDIPGERDRLLTAINSYFEHENIELEGSGIEEMTDDILVNTMAMVCPFDPREKQALLECNDLPSRAQMLSALMTMLACSEPGTSNSNRH